MSWWRPGRTLAGKSWPNQAASASDIVPGTCARGMEEVQPAYEKILRISSVAHQLSKYDTLLSFVVVS